MKRFVFISLCLAMAASAMTAGLSSKFRDWDKSPIAQFMTADERAQWKTIKTDAEAGKFVADFKARRVAGFEAEVDKRAAMADKHLTIGRTPGSKSMRGKVLILFGPPAKVEVQTGSPGAQLDAIPEGDSHSNVGSGFVEGGADEGGSLEGNVPTKSTSYRPTATIYTFSFNDPNLMKVLGRKELVVKVEADSLTGRDRVGKKTQAELEQLFQVVAQHSIVSDSSAQQ